MTSAPKTPPPIPASNDSDFSEGNTAIHNADTAVGFRIAPETRPNDDSDKTQIRSRDSLAEAFDAHTVVQPRPMFTKEPTVTELKKPAAPPPAPKAAPAPTVSKSQKAETTNPKHEVPKTESKAEKPKSKNGSSDEKKTKPAKDLQDEPREARTGSYKLIGFIAVVVLVIGFLAKSLFMGPSETPVTSPKTTEAQEPRETVGAAGAPHASTQPPRAHEARPEAAAALSAGAGLEHAQNTEAVLTLFDRSYAKTQSQR